MDLSQHLLRGRRRCRNLAGGEELSAMGHGGRASGTRDQLVLFCNLENPLTKTNDVSVAWLAVSEEQSVNARPFPTWIANTGNE